MQGLLGEGSYGKVYQAVEKSTMNKYAIKVLDKYHIMKVIFILIIFKALKSGARVPREGLAQVPTAPQHHQVVLNFSG